MNNKDNIIKNNEDLNQEIHYSCSIDKERREEIIKNILIKYEKTMRRLADS